MRNKTTSEKAKEMYTFGLRYLKGERISLRRAFNAFKTACDMGHADACYELRHEFGRHGYDNSNPRTLSRVLHRAAEMGSIGAMVGLGVHYAVGTGLGHKDLKLSFKWYCRAAIRGDIDAQYEVGLMRCTGEGCTKSVKAGMKWLHKAAKGGHEQAKEVLIVAYSEGSWGIRKNRAEAKRLK